MSESLGMFKTELRECVLICSVTFESSEPRYLSDTFLNLLYFFNSRKIFRESEFVEEGFPNVSLILSSGEPILMVLSLDAVT